MTEVNNWSWRKGTSKELEELMISHPITENKLINFKYRFDIKLGFGLSKGGITVPINLNGHPPSFRVLIEEHDNPLIRKKYMIHEFIHIEYGIRGDPLNPTYDNILIENLIDSKAEAILEQCPYLVDQMYWDYRKQETTFLK